MISLPAKTFLPHCFRNIALLVLSTVMMSSAFAFNRIDAVQVLNSVRSDWTESSPEIWINNLRGEVDPGVFVGDQVELSMASTLPGYFLVALVDPRGETTIIMTGSGAPAGQLVFPGNSEMLEQSAPVGEQSLIAFASDAAFSAAQLGLADSIDTLSKDRASLDRLATALNNHPGKIAVSPRYTYFVDSPDNKISTRGLRKALGAQMEEMKLPPRNTPVPEPTVVKEPVVIVEAPPQTTGEATASASSALSLDIKFKYNSYELEAEGMSQLDVLGSGLISLLEANQLPRISLEGHTDSSGPEEYNLDLSGKRARAARDYLVNTYGLPATDIESYGMGEGSPMFDNSTPESRAKNRRVELRIVR